jgi:uncharacterized protein
MKKLDRRRFLKSGLVGAAGIVALPSKAASGLTSEQEKKIIYRTIGKTGIKVPVVSMGVMNANNPALVKAALDKGITFFDTANVYQNGRNEEMLGSVFKDYKRDSFVIATKVMPLGSRMNPGSASNSAITEDFISKTETSLKRLKLDYVDILYIHGVDSPDMLSSKPVVNAIQKLKADGKTRFIGVSTHNFPAIADATVKAGIWDVVLTTYNYLNSQVIRDRAEPPVKGIEEAIKKAGEAGIGIVAMKTLAGGGFLDKERSKPINTTAAIKWALLNPYVSTTIPGMTSFDQLDLNVKIMEDITLNVQEKKDIAYAQSQTGLYCINCKNCVSGCTKNLPIPEIMRAYMYAYGYTNREMAQNLLTELATGDNPCNDCNNCKVKCSKNFDVKQKITDVSRIVNIPSEFIV